MLANQNFILGSNKRSEMREGLIDESQFKAFKIIDAYSMYLICENEDFIDFFYAKKKRKELLVCLIFDCPRALSNTC